MKVRKEPGGIVVSFYRQMKCRVPFVASLEPPTRGIWQRWEAKTVFKLIIDFGAGVAYNFNNFGKNVSAFERSR